ncbi:MAG: hypothetical protein IJS00_07670 [Paludibacteraceae bacterium]|nr:hypothetical protein [Paludibacteraceae bacterium]
MRGAANEDTHSAANEDMRSAANEDTHSAANEATLKTKEESSVSSAAAGISPQSKSSFRAPIKHNRLRRKTGHDYTAPCVYLITVVTKKQTTHFRNISRQ